MNRALATTPRRIILGVVVSLILLGAILFFRPSSPSTSSGKIPVYKGKSLEAWFYGSATRTNFLQQNTRRAAGEAIQALGTNAFPFLLARLKEKRGNNLFYFKFYRVMPAWLRARLTYPLSGDDIKAVALQHISDLRNLTSEHAGTLVDCVLPLANPSLRMMGLEEIEIRYPSDPAFLKLCRKLLDDEHPGIRLRAAMGLAGYSRVDAPGDPRVIPMLLAALEDKEKRKPVLDIDSYWFEQQPPGRPGPGVMIPPLPPGIMGPDAGLSNRITTFLEWHEHRMTDEQKAHFRQARLAKFRTGY